MNKKYLKTMASLILGLSISWNVLGYTSYAEETSNSTFFSSDIFTKDTSQILNSTGEEGITAEKMEEDIYIPNIDGPTLLSSENDRIKKGIKITVQNPKTYEPYDNPGNNTKASPLDMSILVAISEANIKGAYLELSLDGFNTSNGSDAFTYFTTKGPIFSLVPLEKPAENSIFESFEMTSDNKILRAYLKETKTSVGNVNLKFELNEIFKNKIPPKQIIWEDIHVDLYNSEDEKINSVNNGDISSPTSIGFQSSTNYQSPDNGEYSSGNITVRTRTNTRDYTLFEIDPEYNNRAFIELPIGTDVSSADWGSIDFKTGFTKDEDNLVEDGYIRYYGAITDEITDFPILYTTDSNSRYRLNDVEITPNMSKLDIGDIFYYKHGTITKKMNGQPSISEESLEFKVIKSKEWELSGTGNHDTGSGNRASTRLNLDDPNSISYHRTAFGWSTYRHNWTIKNTGSEDITGVKYNIYNNRDKDASEKINFNTVRVFGLNEDGLPKNQQTYYRAEFAIINTADNEKNRTIKLKDKMKNETLLNLPSLNKHEFIQSISVIPLGTDGESEGHLPSKNAITIRYTAKQWDNNTFPDDTKISDKSVTEVPISLAMNYNDEDGIARVRENDLAPAKTYFLPKGTSRASAFLNSSDSKNRLPGQIMNYSIQGNVDAKYVDNNLEQPIVAIAIPNAFALVDPDDNKDFIDSVNNKTYKDSVEVFKTGDDDNFTYYTFESPHPAYLVTGTGHISYEIPIQLKIKELQPAGTYEFGGIAVSSKEFFLQHLLNMNNFSLKNEKLYGLDRTKNNYTGYTNANTVSASISRLTSLSASTAGRGLPSESWSNTTGFAVEKGGTPQMRLKIENTGNTQFGSTRIYNILPGEDDGRGSTGNITFTGVTSKDNAKIYYSTKPKGTGPDKLPEYGEKIHEWSDQKIKDAGFTTTKPAPDEMSKVTAILIDFENQVIKPGESLEAILDFKVPNADNQVAINQFQYGAKEVDGLGELYPVSDKITFSTEIFTINYEEKLPDILTEGTEHAANVPEESQSVLLDLDGNGTITLSDKVPTLPGYTFDGWQDKTTSETYQANAKVDYNSNMNTNTTLYTLWKPNKYTINYYNNHSKDDTQKFKTKESVFGTSFDLDDVGTPEKTGYTFMGWSKNKGDNNEVHLTDDSVVSVASNQNYYAVWEANKYTVSFDKTSGDETQEKPMKDIELTYDKAENLPKNTYTKDRHKLIGWSRKKDGDVDIFDEGEALNLTTKPDDKVTLYAKWERIKSEATVEYKLFQDNKRTDFSIMTDELKGDKRVKATKSDDLIGDNLFDIVKEHVDAKDVSYGYSYHKAFYADPDDNDKIKEITDDTKVPKKDNYTIYITYNPRFHLEVPDQVNFPKQPRFEHREDIMLDFNDSEELNIVNTYETSAGPHAFTVSARTSTWLTHNNHKLDSLFYYKTQNESEMKYINTDFVKIEDRQQVHTQIPLTSKNKQNGLGLRVFGERTDMEKGQYDGEIEWLIQFAP